MDAWTRRSLIAGTAALLFCCGLSLPNASGTEALREDFEERGAVAGAAGRESSAGHSRAEREFRVHGSAEVRPFAPGAAAKGAISFDLLRIDVTPEQERATIFTLAGDARKGDGTPADEIFYLQVRWASAIDTDRPALLFRGQIFYEYGLGLWSPEVLLDQPVQVGQWIHVDLAWDDGAGRYDVFVDGRPQDTDPLFYDPGSLRRQPDPRPEWNREAAGAGNAPYFKSRRFGQMLAQVDEIHIGAHTMRSEPGVLYTPLSSAVLDNLVVHVGEIPPLGYHPPAGPAPVIAELSHNALRTAGFSGKLVEGNALGVSLHGTPGATATFDVAHLPDFGRRVALDWRGWGVSLEEKTFPDPTEVSLREVEAYLVYGSAAPFDPAAPGMEPAARLEVRDQVYTFENLEIDKPYYVAVVAEMRDQTHRTVLASPMGLPMAESADEPGLYAGSWAVGGKDLFPRAVIVGHLAAKAGAAVATLAGGIKETFAADPALKIAVATEPRELKADGKSTAKVTVTVTNANGDPVAGRTIKFLLATTSQYTGVVGGGAFAEQVGGALKESTWGRTNLFGTLTTTYTAGFAAKTAVIVAREMGSNSTGAGYVKTYVQASASLELEPAVETTAMSAGYEITVSSSDEWLTADGRSQARITARVTLAGEPVAGHRVGFAVTGGGSIRAVSDTTDKRGEARAVYTAGTKIGIALITATDETVGLSASVSIELRSDAPAKIRIKIDPEKLPADGRSTAGLLVQVTDINDNPNDNVEVEYAIASGGGSLRDERGLTDRRGESTTEYRAGKKPGTVTFEVTVRSTVPTDEELAKARSLALAVPDSRFF